MSKLILALTVVALIGCGELPDKDFGRECEVHDDMYSHSVVFCGGVEDENISDVFIACNPRVQRDSQMRKECVHSYDLMDLDPDCLMHHVCWRTNG
jgi:hypothetical protein